MFLGDYMLDPPDDPPIDVCRDCDGTGEGDSMVVHPGGNADPVEVAGPCVACDGEGERYLTLDEVRDDAAERAIERAEARRDGDL
jgi:hypothetical protein